MKGRTSHSSAHSPLRMREGARECEVAAAAADDDDDEAADDDDAAAADGNELGEERAGPPCPGTHSDSRLLPSAWIVPRTTVARSVSAISVASSRRPPPSTSGRNVAGPSFSCSHASSSGSELTLTRLPSPSCSPSSPSAALPLSLSRPSTSVAVPAHPLLCRPPLPPLPPALLAPQPQQPLL
jgi:hypothetical protein